MIPKSFDEIGLTDIENLVENGFSESMTLEYKEAIALGKDEDKKEFLADVSSFANAGGGDIIFGIKDLTKDGKNTGIPEEIIPLTNGTPDELIQQMEGVLLTGLDPRLRIQIKEIRGVNGNNDDYILVVRIPQSPGRPHMVIHKGTSRFWGRHNTGKFRLDVDQIRSAFFTTESQADKVRQFIRERLGAIAANETPVKLGGTPRLVIHLIPINSFLNRERVIIPEPDDSLSRYLVLSGQRMNYSTYSLDGYVTHSRFWQPEVGCGGYCQLQFTGVIESVDSSLAGNIDWHNSDGSVTQKSVIYLFDFDEQIPESIQSYIECYRELGISPPFLLSVALLGFRGVVPKFSPLYRPVETTELDRNVALLPSIVIEDANLDIHQVLKPILDSLWNAFGIKNCFDYNQEGIWEPVQRRR